MINHFPFFRPPFYSYSRNYPKMHYPSTKPILTNIQSLSNHNTDMFTEIRENGEPNYKKSKNMHEKKSSKYYHLGPFLINTNGFSNKEEPLLEISGQKLYLDDLIILSLLFFLYKENVKDDVLFMLLILLLVS